MITFREYLQEGVKVKYKLAKSVVSGMKVRKGPIPNTDSISATFNDWKEHGIREIPLSDFGGPRTFFYSADDFRRARELADQIQQSQEITPLIVVVDKDGPYVLEGAHRAVALIYLKKRTLPALVITDKET
jgi:hypothetical protein